MAERKPQGRDERALDLRVRHAVDDGLALVETWSGHHAPGLLDRRGAAEQPYRASGGALGTSSPAFLERARVLRVADDEPPLRARGTTDTGSSFSGAVACRA